MKLLRNPDFQHLLLNYQRAKRVFLIGYEAKDSVTSRQLFGKYDKPEDYLEAFTSFIRNNKDQLDALRVLRKRPQDWNPEVLSKLRGDLGSHGFGEKRLRDAHKKVHHALADVISIVKHAINEQEPLLTPEQRVATALEELKAFHAFTLEQEKWLAFIGKHLEENLSISEDDLDSQPVFTNRGGLARARKLFGNELAKMIERINYTLAAA